MEAADGSFDVDLSTEEARRILKFPGYGRLLAPIWFIGLEEGLGKQDSVDWAHNLRARGKWDEVMDLERAHLLLHEGGKPIQIAGKPPRTQTWRWMANICRGLSGRLDWRDPQAAEEYVRRRLGRADPAVGETFLTELSPIPSKNLATNKKWANFFGRATPDCDELIKARWEELRALIEQSPPKFVFCYGSACRVKFKLMFPKRSWKTIGDNSELSESEGCVSVLTPFFISHRGISTECQAVMMETSNRGHGRLSVG